MRYCGSKRRFMKHLLPILTDGLDETSCFVDLFGGGMNVISEIPTKNKIAVDNNKYIIALWQELKLNGMRNIPSSVTEEEYQTIKQSYMNNECKFEDFLIGYVGACCSFGGSWFNGYARFNPNKKEDHIKEAYNGLKTHLERFKFLEDTTFLHSSYDEIKLNENDIVYCDPPYANTKRYLTDFDHHKFYEWCRNNHHIAKNLYISEYQMPDDFKCILTIKKKDGLGVRQSQKQNIKLEKLFIVK